MIDDTEEIPHDVPEPWVFDWHEENEVSRMGFTAWIVPHVIGGRGTGPQRRLEQIRDASDDFTKISITMQVNGVEVDAEELFSRMQQNLEWSARCTAISFITEVSRDLVEPMEVLLSDVQQNIKNYLVRTFRERGIEIDEEHDFSDW